MAQYFYQKSEVEQGPVSTRELVELIASETLPEQVKVRESGQNKWLAADEIPGLMRSVNKQRSKSIDTTASVEPDKSASPVIMGKVGRNLKNKRRALTDVPSSTEVVPDEPRRSSFIFIVPVLIISISAIWLFTRPARFPKPASADASGPAIPVTGTELPLSDVRVPAADPPTLNIPVGAVQPVPGLEVESGLSSPSLSDDLKTIAFVKRGDVKDDLFLARRDSVEKPFPTPIRLDCSTKYTEAFCSLSPNGTQLLFTVQENGPSRLMLATSSDNFSSAKRVLISGVDLRRQHVDNPQWLDEDSIRVVIGDLKFTQRSQSIAIRQPGGEFKITEELTFQNPWPRMHLSRDRKRAYFQGESGILLSAPKYQTDEFGMGQILAASDIVGTFDSSADDTVFVVPQEDIIFFTGPGPDGSSPLHKLWMIRP